MRVLGVTPVVRTTRVGRGGKVLRVGQWATVTRGLEGYKKFVPFDERFAGGPLYIYETARRAYRDAAARCHPDHGGSEDAMRLVNAAWAYIRKRWGPN